MEQSKKRPGKNMLSFFKPTVNIVESDVPSHSNVIDTLTTDEQPPPKIQRVEFDETSLVRDPGLRLPIWNHPVNQHDEIRRAYIKKGPYQPFDFSFPPSKFGNQRRSFQSSWYNKFFHVVHVKDTTALTLKEEISDVLTRYNLEISNMRGQGYDGASNMRGAWKGLQALFIKDCPYAYYIHCFAHRLQLALVTAAETESSIWLFFSQLDSVVNLVGASPKRHTQLQSAQSIEVERLIDTGERETGRGANQMGNLHRAGTTRWSSHFDSICSFIDMFNATIQVLQVMYEMGSTNPIRGEAKGHLLAIRSFEFIFILHLMHRTMGISDLLCKALQQKSLDIGNAMALVSTTKELLKLLRDEGFDNLLACVQSFCKEHNIDIPDMAAHYKSGTGRTCQQKDVITVEHRYHYDIFNEAIDFQLRELNDRFSEGVVELLVLSLALEPKDGFKSLNIDDICTLAEKFYPDDFTQHERQHLRLQLEHYKLDVPHHQAFLNMSIISELCRGLVETKKSENYYLIERLICLVATLLVTTAIAERAFSAIKIVKTDLRNKMEDDFLADSMIIFIERELVQDITADSIIDDFYSLKHRRVQLK